MPIVVAGSRLLGRRRVRVCAVIPVVVLVVYLLVIVPVVLFVSVRVILLVAAAIVVASVRGLWSNMVKFFDERSLALSGGGGVVDAAIFACPYECCRGC